MNFQVFEEAQLQVYRDERKLEKMEKVARSSIGTPNPARHGGACQAGSANAIAAAAPQLRNRLERTSVSLISADPLSTASNGAGASLPLFIPAVLSGSCHEQDLHLCTTAAD